MLSNFHVMCVDNTWAAGNTMAQPSRVDGGSCPADHVGALDAGACSRRASTARWRRSRAAHTSARSSRSATSTARPWRRQNMAVRKRGRTTELTHGTVTAVDYTTSVDYGDGLGVVTFTNQIRIVNDAAQSAFFGKKGDSGSVVVDSVNNVVGPLLRRQLDRHRRGRQPDRRRAVGARRVDVHAGSRRWRRSRQGVRQRQVVEAREARDQGDRGQGAAQGLRQGVEGVRVREVRPVGGKLRPWERTTRGSGRGGGSAAGRRRRRPGGAGGRPAGRSPGRSAARQPRRAAEAVDDRSRTASTSRTLPVGPVRQPGRRRRRSTSTSSTHLGAPLGRRRRSSTGARSPGSTPGGRWRSRWTASARPCRRRSSTSPSRRRWRRTTATASLAGTATMTPTQMVAQTLTIEGTAIAFVRITCPQDETILLGLCCCADTTCKGRDEEKPFLADHKAVVKDKELKEPKEFKEPTRSQGARRTDQGTEGVQGAGQGTEGVQGADQGRQGAQGDPRGRVRALHPAVDASGSGPRRAAPGSRPRRRSAHAPQPVLLTP